MKRIQQTAFGSGKGNCFAACIASLLEVPLDEVPSPRDGETESQGAWDGYMDRLSVWLSGRGWWLMELQPFRQMLDGSREPWFPPGRAMAVVPSPRVWCGHSVCVLNGEVEWDPFPGGLGPYGGAISYTVLVPFDPCKM